MRVNKNISYESAGTVKKSRPIVKARAIILLIVFSILAAGAICFLSFYIKAWALISKMDHFEYLSANEKVVTKSVSQIECKYTFNSLFFKQRLYEGKLYLKDGSALEICYFYIEPGRFALLIDGYKGTFEFHFDPGNPVGT